MKPTDLHAPLVPDVPAVSRAVEPALWSRWQHKTQPLGALGHVERIAVQIGCIQNNTHPVLQNPHVLVFAADHGLAAEGTSAYPQAVTRQMVANFLAGGAAISVLSRQHSLALRVVDCGVAGGAFPSHDQLWDYRLGDGTANSLHMPALTAEQLTTTFAHGAAIVQRLQTAGCNALLLGEMGIGNTSAAALLLHKLGPMPLLDCIGPGTGLQGDGLAHKRRILSQVAELHVTATEPLEALRCLGGFEIAVMTATILHAAREQMTIIADGFITSAAVLAAVRLQPAVLDYVIASHSGAEPAHKHLLALLNLRPLLQLDLRLGEGNGAALAYPIVQSSIQLLAQMASFAEAGVSTATASSTPA